MSRQYLGVQEVAARYRVRPKTIYRMVERGELPYRKLPGRKAVLFVEEELDRFDDEQCSLEWERLPNRGIRVRPRVVTPSLQNKEQKRAKTGKNAQ